MNDRIDLHKICDAQQERIDKLNDKIVEIYKTRNERLVIEKFQAGGVVKSDTNTGKIPPMTLP